MTSQFSVGSNLPSHLNCSSSFSTNHTKQLRFKTVKSNLKKFFNFRGLFQLKNSRNRLRIALALRIRVRSPRSCEGFRRVLT